MSAPSAENEAARGVGLDGAHRLHDQRPNGEVGPDAKDRAAMIAAMALLAIGAHERLDLLPIERREEIL